jgi:hypothetical protein
MVNLCARWIPNLAPGPVGFTGRFYGVSHCGHLGVGQLIRRFSGWTSRPQGFSDQSDGLRGCIHLAPTSVPGGEDYSSQSRQMGQAPCSRPASKS